ncbi:MAG TPA: hypothetical protein VGC10_07515 [Sphingomonas sp.]
MTMPRHDPVPTAAERDAEIRRRQRSRSIVTAAILFGLVILFYAISIAKML